MTPPPDTTPRAAFLALEVPAEARRAVIGMLGRLPDEVDAAWTRPEGWHVTVAWLDRLDDAGVDRVRGLVDGVVAAGPVAAGPVTAGVVADATAPPMITLDRPIRFGRAVGLRGEASPSVHAVQQALATTLAGGVDDTLSDRARDGLGRPWRPHLTLARARRGGDPARIRAAIASRWTGPVSWPVEGLALVASHVGGGPARYVARHRWRFPA